MDRSAISRIESRTRHLMDCKGICEKIASLPRRAANEVLDFADFWRLATTEDGRVGEERRLQQGAKALG